MDGGYRGPRGRCRLLAGAAPAAISTRVPPLVGRLIRRWSGSMWGVPCPTWAISAAARSRSAALATRASSTSPPIRSLSSAAVPCATIAPASITTMRCARCSASSMYWVVSSTVVPAVTRSSMKLHTSLRVRGIQAGRRLVQEQDPRTADQARPDVEPAAHPARVGLDEIVGGVGQREALQHVLGATAALGPAQTIEQPHELEVLPPGQQFVDGGELTGEADQWAQPTRHRRRRRTPPRVARPLSGFKQRRQDSHERRLARAVRTQQSEHPALLGSEVDTGERLGGAEPLGHPLDLDHRSHRAHPTRIGRAAGGSDGRSYPRRPAGIVRWRWARGTVRSLV